MELLNSIFRRRIPRDLRRGCLLWLVAATCLSGARAPVEREPATLSAEYRVKAGFLFNFPQFVEWPARAFATAQAPIVIGVLGEDPFGSYLDELVRGEKVGQRTIIVRRFRLGEDPADCHVLFISGSEARQFHQIVAALASHSVLTVGDAEGFERAGGMVRLIIENGKIRLHINPEAAKASGLAISSKLLRLATLVTPGKG